MSLILALSFKYETGRISRWIYLNVFQANFSCGSKTDQDQGVNSSPLNFLQCGAEK